MRKQYRGRPRNNNTESFPYEPLVIGTRVRDAGGATARSSRRTGRNRDYQRHACCRPEALARTRSEAAARPRASRGVGPARQIHRRRFPYFSCWVFCFAQTPARTFCLIAPPRGPARNAMLASAECRQRAEHKTGEAALQPRRRKKLRADAECWLVLADRMEQLESSLQAVESVE
jgi:hypothetical protein